VVIPLPRMAEYTDGIERINIELSLRNKIALCDELEAFFSRGDLPLGKQDDAAGIASAELLEDRVAQALAWCSDVRALWQGWLQDVDPLFPQLQDHTLRASWKTQIRDPLATIFTGAAFQPIMDACTGMHQRCSRGGCGWPCTCTPATAMCTPTSRSTATTMKCCRPPTAR
jgi:FAD/FMN-containing dehydrogenase